MKRILCPLLLLCLLLSLAACSPKAEQQPTAQEPSVATQPQPVPTEAQPETEAAQIPTEAPAPEITPIAMEKALYTYLEWDDAIPWDLVRSKHSVVTLSAEAAQAYPEMARVLEQIAVMQENTMLDEFDNLVSMAREALGWDPDGFETYVSTLDVQIRRADSLVISLLNDSYAHFGQIQYYRALHGSNFDPQTGRELMLNEVVDVNNDLALAVEKELTARMWAEPLQGEYTVEDYFANTPYQDFSWTLDYSGITFYFSPGLICEGGPVAVTISFDRYPELFNEEYLAVPETYTVELPLDILFTTELEKGIWENLSVSGWFNEESGKYEEFGAYRDPAGEYFQETCYVYDLHPYYVKAEDGCYLYLFCQDFDEGVRQMHLVVLRLNSDGSITKGGTYNLNPAWLADNRFLVPTDPERMILDDQDKGLEKGLFRVGSDGIPQP